MSHARQPPGLAVDVVSERGDAGDERPRTVTLGATPRRVREVLLRLQRPSGVLFRVVTDDGQVHELLRRASDGSWWLVPWESPLR